MHDELMYKLYDRLEKGTKLFDLRKALLESINKRIEYMGKPRTTKQKETYASLMKFKKSIEDKMKEENNE